MSEKITVKANIKAPVEKAWDYYTHPNHITQWNFADPSWHCPSASNDLTIGGTYKARMEAKDGSFGFDFEAVYKALETGKSFTYSFDNRDCSVTFLPENEETLIEIIFDPENVHPKELQQQGWQSILNNFKTYTENN